MKLVLLCIAFFSVHASTIAGADADGKPYTICGAKRGCVSLCTGRLGFPEISADCTRHTEQDSLEAARHLEEKVILSDQHPLPINECAFAHVNTTVVSVCNGRGHNRTVSREEVRHGIDTLIDDCGLQGGFTGIHVAGDLTFSAYGITGAKRVFNKSVRPGPSTEARTLQSPDEAARSRLQKRECKWAYDGTTHTDCDWKNRIDAGTGKCTGDFDPANDCQVFCELRRTGLYGPESKPLGAAQDRTAPGDTAVLEKGTEYSVTQGFSIGVEGVAKGAVGAGIGYQCMFLTRLSLFDFQEQPWQIR